jgi:hypothetical protein
MVIVAFDIKIAFGRLVLLLASLTGAHSSIANAACTSALKDSNEISRQNSIGSPSDSVELSPPALFRQQKFRPPMGLNEDQMKMLLKGLKNSPHLLAFDVFVIYGSRVHFDFGSKPSTISDLDIAPIPKEPSDISAEIYKEARKTASKLSEDLKVMITFDLRTNQSFSALIQNPDFFNPSTVEDYVRAWKEFQDSPGAKRNHALMIKKAWQAFLQERGLGTWFTKNSIVIFRDNEAAEQWAPVLKSKGFHNWTPLP